MEPSNMAGRGHSALQGSQNSIIREPISIFQEIGKEADPLKKGNLQELLNKLRNLYPSCTVPEYDGMITSSKKEDLWDKYYMGAPKQRRQYVEQYKIVKRA